MERAISAFVEDGIVPFWMWNDHLEKSTLLNQLREIKNKGINQVIIHPRFGLVTPFLSEQWFEAIAWVLEEAVKLEVGLWFYDELNWPSGYAGGKVLAEDQSFRASHLVRSSSGFEKKNSNWHPAYSDHFYIDVLNPAAVDCFIRFAYEGYWQRFSEHFGSVIRGFFTDEPGFYNNIEGIDPGTIPWSDMVPDHFQAWKGYSLVANLSALWSGEDHHSIQIRIDYWDVISRLYQETYFKRISDWCHERRVAFIGHVLFEESLVNTAKSQGDFFGTMRYLDLAGYDIIDRRRPESIIAARLADSARKVFGLKGVCCETFGMFGWDLTFQQMEEVVTWQIDNGLDVLIPHALYYSQRGERREDCPPSFFEKKYWGKYTQFLATVRQKLDSRHGIEPVISIFYPIETIWGFMAIDEPGKAYDVERIFRIVTLTCQNLGFPFDYVNNLVLKDLANRHYQYCILAQTEIISLDALKLLMEFTDNGGEIIIVGAMPAIATKAQDQPEFQAVLKVLEAKMHRLIPPARSEADIPARSINKLYRKIRKFMPGSVIEFTKKTINRMGYGQKLGIAINTGLEGELYQLLDELSRKNPN